MKTIEAFFVNCLFIPIRVQMADQLIFREAVFKSYSCRAYLRRFLLMRNR